MEVLHAGDVETWHRLCSDTFVPLDTVTGEGFVGQIEHVRMQDVRVSRVTCTPCRVGRTRRTILAEPRPDVLVNLVDRGAGLVLTSEGRTLLAEGDAALCEADAQYELDMPAPVTVLTLQLDRTLLPIADTRIHAAHGLQLRSAARVAVLRHFMTGVLAGGSLGFDHHLQYGVIARDLLLLALHEHDDLASTVEDDSAYVVVRACLERQFTDPNLTIDGVARQLRVSRRYVEGVFARHDRSPAAFLRSLRIDRAKAILAASTSGMVGEAPRRSGFNDSDTFSRAFRRSTGLPPDTWRQRLRREAAAQSPLDPLDPHSPDHV